MFTRILTIRIPVFVTMISLLLTRYIPAPCFGKVMCASLFSYTHVSKIFDDRSFPMGTIIVGYMSVHACLCVCVCVCVNVREHGQPPAGY